VRSTRWPSRGTARRGTPKRDGVFQSRALVAAIARRGTRKKGGVFPGRTGLVAKVGMAAITGGKGWRLPNSEFNRLDPLIGPAIRDRGCVNLT